MGSNSPDLSPYLDLRVYDRDPQDVVNAALQDLQSKLPGWVPREDNTEVILAEAMALEVAEAIFAINRLPGAIITILMKMYGITRNEGTPPSATIRVTVVDTFGYTIPVGTRFTLAVPGTTNPVIFTTTSPVIIPNGNSYIDVALSGNVNTSLANGIAAGVSLGVIDYVSFIETAVLQSSVTGGTDPETDQAWATRGVARLSRLADTLVVPSHFTAAALEYDYVERATTVDLYDPAVGPDPGDNPGNVTVAVYGYGTTLTTDQKNAILADFQNRSQANLSIHVVDPTITSVDVTVTVHRFVQYEDADTVTAVQTAVEQYLNPSTWPWAGVVRVNELIALISNIPNVDYVESLTVPSVDQAIGGVAPLATAGTITVTVTAP